MHKQILILLTCVIAMHCANASPVAQAFDDDGWSWRHGLLGRNTPDGDIFVDQPYPGVICDTCRDPYEHPMDFVAVAYNSYFGDKPWLRGSILGTPFRIYNLNRQWVVVWFEGIAFDGISLLPNTMQIHVRLQNGQILTFSVIQGGPDLPIGDPNPAPPAGDNNCGCGGGGGGDDGDDDYADPDDYEPGVAEEPEHSGVVEIEDPDEDDNFPEWDL